MPEKETITITKAEYEQLLESEAQLDFLAALGVDNWSEYATLPVRSDYDTDKAYEGRCS